jgi:hypothetical protein
MFIFKGKNNNKYWQNAMKQEPLYTVGGNAIQYNPYGKQYGDSLKS